MPLEDDDEICFCFHVSLRKVKSFCRIEKPKVASQISQCLSAGTGCGWCRPMLRKIHRQECEVVEPWWRKTGDDASDAEYHSAERDADASQLDVDRYAGGRQTYLKETGARPPQTDRDS